MNCDIYRKITEDKTGTDPTKDFRLLFRTSTIAVPVRIKTHSLLCVTESVELTELYFKRGSKSFSSTRHLHLNTLLTVEVRVNNHTQEVRLFLGAAERLVRY
ncbi:hypothetical protein QCK34_004468 [Enterobacter asburiae]|nr:hypothetical protein [Enterobacter asburiae]